MPVMGCDGESSNSPGSFISNNSSLNSSMGSSTGSSHGGSMESFGGTSPAVCAGCGGRISDRFYLLAADRQWHTQCLQCCDCNVQLDSELSCFAKEGNIYCKEDYLKRYGSKKCARCQVGIDSQEMVMRARDLVYHIACFSCAVCNLELTTGDYYGMRDNLVYCQLHYETLFVPTTEPNTGFRPLHHHHQHQHASPPPPSQQTFHSLSPSYHTHGGSPTSTVSSTGHPFFQNGLSPIHKGRPRKRKGVDHLIGFGMGMGDSCDPMGHHGHHPGLDGDMYHQQVPAARTKRMRTSFKHHQLRTMKSYFAMNHNPDAKDLKQLAHKTGLTKRVLQVWFQNARAKYRRTTTKKDDEKSEKNASECSGDQPSPSAQVDDQDNISITSSGGCGGGGSGSDPTADTMYDGDDDNQDELLDDITTYSELKTASPAVADEVSTISSMPASARMLHGLHPPGSAPGNTHHGMGLMSHGFVEIFSNQG